MSNTWDNIGQLVAWLDREAPQDMTPNMQRMMRVLKIGEEFGEVAEALHGVTGSNPRKAREGESHTWDDVEKELCDVVLTAMVALRTITPDAGKIFEENLERVTRRSLS